MGTHSRDDPAVTEVIVVHAETLFEREDQLEHGTGVGLWLVRWITGAAGQVSFEDDDRVGTTVVVELRRAVGDDPATARAQTAARLAEPLKPPIVVRACGCRQQVFAR